jgi:hypothetical protein
MKLPLKRRIGLAISRWLYELAYWFDLHSASKFDPTAEWPKLELTDAEWEEYKRIIWYEEI